MPFVEPSQAQESALPGLQTSLEELSSVFESELHETAAHNTNDTYQYFFIIAFLSFSTTGHVKRQSIPFHLVYMNIDNRLYRYVFKKETANRGFEEFD